MMIVDPALTQTSLASALRRDLLRDEEKEKRSNWEDWLWTHLRAYFTDECGDIHLSDHHDDIWRWLFAVPPSGTDQDPPDALLAILARGHGKSTTAEAGCVWLGAEQIRRYGVYVCGTQALADKHLVAISHMLRSPGIAAQYPEVANPKIERHTTQDGTKSRQLAWRRNMLWTEGGFAMEAMGLDTAIRGAKLDAQRPDFFVLDDLDDRRDTEATVQKKIDALTTAILPAGTKDVAVLGVQNLVHKNSIFSKLIDQDDRADFLVDRKVIGPVPALKNMTIGKDDEGRDVITGGDQTWQGMSLDACKREARMTGLRAFRIECQHEVELDEGLFLSDVWSEPTHVLPLAGFVPPVGWRIDRSFDWGSSRPYACIWWAESDGSPCTIAGRQRTFPRGTLLALCELYGWNNKPDTGLRHSDAQIAMAIRQAQAQYPWANRCQIGFADNQIFDVPDNNTGQSIYDRMVSATGQKWTRSQKGPGSRIAGATGIVNRLQASLVEPMERPGLFFSSGCRNIIRTLPALPAHPTIDGDVDSDSEDHLWDAIRYRVFQKVQKTTRTRVSYR